MGSGDNANVIQKLPDTPRAEGEMVGKSLHLAERSRSGYDELDGCSQEPGGAPRTPQQASGRQQGSLR